MKALVSILILFAVPIGTPALAAGNTARALLPQATAEAKKWQPDSTLVNIDTRSASPAGTAAIWAYSFYSPRSKAKVLIMADGKGPPSREDSGYYRTAPVGEFSVDSDQAMAAAVRNGLKTRPSGMGMSLESAGAKAEWRILDQTHFYYVDAASGKFLRSEKTD